MPGVRRLFEDFVTGFYEREQHLYQVNPGGRRRIDWADTDATDAAPAPASCDPTTSTNCSRTCGTARPPGRTGRGTRASCCTRRWATSR